MIIQHNLPSLNAHRNISYGLKNISDLMEKLSNGRRLLRSSDDAAGLGISERMKSNMLHMDQSVKNSADALSLLQTAEGGLKESHNILNRLMEIAEMSSSSTIDDRCDRYSLQQEYEALLSELNSISSSTRYNNRNLLDGTLDFTPSISDEKHYLSEFIDNMRFIMNEAIIVKNDSAVIFGENGEIKFFTDSFENDGIDISLTIKDMSSSGLYLNKTSVSSQMSARRSLETIKKAIDCVSETRMEIGITENRIQVSSNNLQTFHENLNSSQSRIADIDTAKAVVDLAKSQIITKAAQSALAQANMHPKSILDLIGIPSENSEKKGMVSEIPDSENSKKSNKPNYEKNNSSFASDKKPKYDNKPSISENHSKKTFSYKI